MGTTVLPQPYADSTAKGPSPHILLSLAAAGAVVGITLIVLAATGEGIQEPGLSAFLACWLTLPFIAAGLIAWRRRPESRLGVLMVTTGFITFTTFLNWSANDVLYTIGAAVQFLVPALLLHVFLAFPSGRLQTRLDRVVVAAGFGAVALTLLRMLFGDGGERNLVAVVDNPTVVTSLRAVQLAFVSAVLLMGTTSLVLRRRRDPPLRTPLGLLAYSFSLALAMIALLYLVQLFAWTSVIENVRLATFGIIGLAPIVFLVAILDARLGRASVGDLVEALGVNPGPADLQEAVARALRDPSVRLAYWLPEFDSYADVDGRQIELEDSPGRSSTPVKRDDQPVAMLLHDSALDDEPRLLSSVVSAIGMTIENAQLQVELRARLEELRGSRARILQAEQSERRRLERDLHDGAQQRLIALTLELGELGDRLDGDAEIRTRIDSARQEVTASIAELRDLAHGIHPAAVSDHGLAVALESVATRATVPVEVIGATQDRLPEQVELAAFFIVCEALTNVARHAEATSAVVELERNPGALIVEVRDDGIGGASADTGSGLRGLADRVEALGGRLQVWSPVGQGTRLRAEIPCG
ncbi:MAG TPA: histidine kinase [Acidimicrobiia bacterium]|jgi:signal transduction histidine kinase